MDSPWKLACFDLDGTLTRGVTTCQHIAKRLGDEDHLTLLETHYAKGLISNREVAIQDAVKYKGQTRQDIEEILLDIPLITGIAETVHRLRQCDIPSVICTVTWHFAAEIIAKRFGFVAWSGTEMEQDHYGHLSGRPSLHFDEYGKRAFVENYCRENCIPLHQVFAVGDARSDIPLFTAVGFSLALNASVDAQNAATASLDTNDLRKIFEVIPGLAQK